jgi:hypothetical protein
MELHSVEAIVKALNAARVKYLIVGGLAVNAHGYVRMTRDVDIVLQLKKENIERGLQALFDIGYQLAIPVKAEDFGDAKIRERWRVEKNMIVLKLWSDAHERTPVDIFVYEPFEFEKEYRQAHRYKLRSGLLAKVVTLDALLKMKREAGRSQDLIDIKELRRHR